MAQRTPGIPRSRRDRAIVLTFPFANRRTRALVALRSSQPCKPSSCHCRWPRVSEIPPNRNHYLAQGASVQPVVGVFGLTAWDCRSVSNEFVDGVEAPPSTAPPRGLDRYFFNRG
jgi:hypothetical protein